MSDEKQLVHKVKLSSGKIVHLKQMKIKDQNLAIQAVGSKAGDNNFLMATMMQQELLKILIVDIDGKVPAGADREDLDALFSYPEFQQLLKVVGKLMGGEEGECETEIVNIGKR